MSFKEFQAWMEGFTEAFDDGKPSKKQWEKIQKKMKSVTDGFPMCTLPHYPYRQWNDYPWYPQITWGTSTTDSISITTTNADVTDVTDTVVVDAANNDENSSDYLFYEGLEWHDPNYAQKAFNEKINRVTKQFN